VTIASERTHIVTNLSVSVPLSHPALPTGVAATGAALARVAEVLATRERLWVPLVQRVLGDGCPATTRVAAAEIWEAWLQVWPAGGAAAWHAHERASAHVVLAGALHESRDAQGRHRLVAEPGGMAASLHVYAPVGFGAGRAEAQLCRPTRAGEQQRGEPLPAEQQRGVCSGDPVRGERRRAAARRRSEHVR
jgi:hypothetical protein